MSSLGKIWPIGHRGAGLSFRREVGTPARHVRELSLYRTEPPPDGPEIADRDRPDHGVGGRHQRRGREPVLGRDVIHRDEAILRRLLSLRGHGRSSEQGNAPDE